ncbi:MAG: hypothetical protein GXP40_02980 [Chloroflexi bacterium]|nr:hypothetical protein [Chloroflexota bacterium]
MAGTRLLSCRAHSLLRLRVCRPIVAMLVYTFYPPPADLAWIACALALAGEQTPSKTFSEAS